MQCSYKLMSLINKIQLVLTPEITHLDLSVKIDNQTVGSVVSLLVFIHLFIYLFIC